MPALCGSQRWSRRSTGLVAGVAGDPGIDLCPGSFQPWAQLVGLRKLRSRDEGRADKQLPVDRQLPPRPCPPVWAEAVVGEYKDIGVGRPADRSGGTAGARRQRIGAS